MAKYVINEVRAITYTVDVPDGRTTDDLKAAHLDSLKFWCRGAGGMLSEWHEVHYSVEPAPADDDEPADVKLDDRLHDTWPAEPSKSAVPAPHGSMASVRQV